MKTGAEARQAMDSPIDPSRSEFGTYGTYVSLGDSISIDLYPGYDLQEREDLSHVPEGLGAASLFHENDDGRWPEFEGRDLTTMYPGIRHVDLTQDGATTRATLELQLPRIPADVPGPVLVTLTAGGNDLVALLHLALGEPASRTRALAGEIVEDAAGTLRRIVRRLRVRFERSTLVVGTVYDPSDGTGDLGDGVQRDGALEALVDFNGHVRALTREAGAVLAPIHDHFVGHGRSEADPAARWYWRHNVIEPSARGASEVRRLWLEALGL